MRRSTRVRRIQMTLKGKRALVVPLRLPGPVWRPFLFAASRRCFRDREWTACTAEGGHQLQEKHGEFASHPRTNRRQAQDKAVLNELPHVLAGVGTLDFSCLVGVEPGDEGTKTGEKN
jgi:hypothetical protein